MATIESQTFGFMEVDRVNICWFAPWFAGRSSNYARLLMSMGHTCEVITSNAHLDYRAGLLAEAEVFDAYSSRARRSIDAVRHVRRLSSSSFDVVLCDQPHAPLLGLTVLAVALFQRVVLVVSDPVPHDAKHVDRAIVRRINRWIFQRVEALLTFSPSGQRQLESMYPNVPSYYVNLVTGTSLADSVTPRERRRDFAMVGRYSEYKGFDLGIDLWSEFTKLYRPEDELNLWISGLDEPFAVPDGVNWRSWCKYSWEDFLSALPGYKAVLMPYRSASQSGVQVVCWRAGVATIISDLPGLIDGQPGCLSPAPLVDRAAWLRKLEELSDEGTACRIGLAGRTEIEDRLSECSQSRLWDLLLERFSVR